MNFIAAWIKSKNLSTHAFIVAAVGLAGLIASDPAIQQWIKDTLSAHPSIASGIVVFALAIAKAWPSSSAAGTLATANYIKAQPDAPTAAQVDAATTK
jgi:hypothetical protein